MASLSDFNAPVKKPKLSDFFATGRKPSPVLSPASINNVAAQTAAIDPSGDVNGTYLRVTDELNYGSSDIASRITSMFDEADQQSNNNTLLDIAGDPSLPIEQREAAIRNGSVSGANRIRSFYERTAQAALMANSEDDDNDEMEMVRLDTAGVINEVDAYNGWVQQELNRMDALSDTDTAGTIKNIVELMVPFFEQASGAQVSAQLFEGDEIGNVAQALTLLGDNKAAVRDAIQAMPIEQRYEFASKVMEVVKASSGPTAFTENDIVMMNELNAYLKGQSYGDDDKMVDNIFSLLDASLLFAPAAMIGKAAGKPLGAVVGLAKATGDARSSKAALARAEAALGDLGRTPEEMVETTKAEAPLLLEHKPTPAFSPADDIDNIIDSLPVEPTKAEIDDLRVAITNNVDDIDKVIGEAKIVDRLNSEQVNNIRAAIGRIRDKKRAAENPEFTTQYPERSNVVRQSVRTRVQPMSVAQIYAHTNPSKARLAHRIAMEDQSGKAAEVLYGTNKVDAIANDVLPEVKTVNGSVRNKVEMNEAALNPDTALIKHVKDAQGRNEFTKAEKLGMRKKAKDEWRDVQGLVPRRAMSTIGDSDKGVAFDVVYGPKDGGFSDAKQGLDQIKYGLRKYGVTDDQIEVLKFDGKGYVPVTDWSKKGNYLIRVKHEYEFNPVDVVEWSLTKAGNWKLFDAPPPLTSGKSGGLINHLIPSTAYVDRVLLDAATRSADRSAWLMSRLLDLGNEYAKKYKSLDTQQKAYVDTYIVKANAEGLKFNSQAMAAVGMSDKAIDAVRSWKKVQDTLYHFENQDVIKTLRSRGFERYIDQSGSDLIVKPIHINQTGEARVVFDGEHVRAIDRKEIKELYDNGGTIARTRGANTWGDDTFEYVLVRNQADSSYTRQIADSDQILTYRPGYYTVRYTNPFFIRKKMVKKDGGVYWQAIATAGDRKLAEAEIARLRTTDSANEYALSGDIKKGTGEYDDIQWETMVSNGRTAQRIRGERLKEVGTESDINKAHIESPEESLIKSIQSLANRTSHRDFIEAAKKRYISQFKDMVPLNPKTHLPEWPSDVRDIGKNNAEAKMGDVADARATWRYIESIDAGYVNLLDDFSKNFFKFFSDTAGRTGWSWLEKGIRKGEDLAPTAWARKKAFRLLLAFNPLRQLPVQAMQALPVILATNPTAIPRIANQFMLINYVARGGDVDSFFKSMAQTATGLTPAQAKDLIKHYDLSGFEASVKANSLIRDDMKSLIDRGALQKVRGIAAKPGDFFQKIGFEAGENILMRSVWLSEYDKLLRSKKGKSISMEEVENLGAKVRHLTLNMNKAGELAYNENMFSALMQFFQAPHKAFSQVVMQHKGLTTSERLRLGSMYLVTYGLGANFITDMVSKLLPEDSGTRDAFEGGVFNILINKALSNLYGQNVRTDFSDSLRLLAVPNAMQFMSDLVNMQFGEMLTASPSASLVFGDSPRVTRFVQSLLRPFTLENGWTPEEFEHVGKTFLSMASGGSNFLKAKYIMEHQRQIGSLGQTVDWEANHMEALMKAGGFATIDEVHYYAFNDKSYKASKAWKDDISLFVKETSRRLSLDGIANDESEYWLKIMAEAQRVYGNDPEATREIMNQIRFRFEQNEGSIMDTILRLAPTTDEEKMMEMIDVAPMEDGQKQQLRDVIKFLNEDE